MFVFLWFLQREAMGEKLLKNTFWSILVWYLSYSKSAKKKKWKCYSVIQAFLQNNLFTFYNFPLLIRPWSLSALLRFVLCTIFWKKLHLYTYIHSLPWFATTKYGREALIRHNLDLIVKLLGKLIEWEIILKNMYFTHLT